jgi:hypothetical protein
MNPLDWVLFARMDGDSGGHVSAYLITIFAGVAITYKLRSHFKGWRILGIPISLALITLSIAGLHETLWFPEYILTHQSADAETIFRNNLPNIVYATVGMIMLGKFLRFDIRYWIPFAAFVCLWTVIGLPTSQEPPNGVPPIFPQSYFVNGLEFVYTALLSVAIVAGTRLR